MVMMRCRGIRISPTQSLIFLLFFLVSFGQAASWYIGCVEDQSALEALGGLSPLEEVVFSPATCCRRCLQAGFYIAAIQDDSICKCSNSTSLPLINEEHCNNICNGSAGVELRCGGDDTLSVYSVNGPYLHTLELGKTQSIIQQEGSVLFEAKTYLAQEPREDDDLPNLSDTSDSYNEVDFVWFIGNTEQSASTKPSSNDTIQAILVHTFLEEGEWTIGVNVKNPVSSLSAYTNVTVVRPLPCDLQVTLHPNQDDIPSCIPVHDDIQSNLSSTAVFVRENVTFQASLTMGINLTFHWSFSDDGSNSSRAPYLQPTCEGIACLRDSQVHTFMDVGVYRVLVMVSNSLGSVERILNVIVMNRDIANLNMSLADPSSTLREVNSTVNFVVTMVTAARAELILEINFGDGFVYNHSLKDVNDTFILGGEQNIAHLHLTASYGDGCQLLVSLDHKYTSEGLFRPSVSVHSVLSADITASASLSEPLLIQRTLTDVAIESKQVYSTNESAILSITVPVVTANISCAWNIYYTNESLQDSSDCEFMYSFVQAGKYVLAVTAQNLISEVTLERTIVVQDAVTSLQLESQVDALIKTGSDVQLIASVSGGTDINFAWDFSDPFNNVTRVSVLESDAHFLASVANHTYATSGRYNVSVTASNLVTSLKSHLPVEFVVQDSVQGISLPPMLATLLQNPTVIEVQVVRGSHLDFYLDYGSGLISPQVQQIHNGLYIIRHVFPAVATYKVNVVAYNGVSSTNATMTVVVQEDIGSITVSASHPREHVTVLLANIDGAIPNRTNVKYTWDVGGSIHVTATPLLEVFNITVDGIRVFLKAENQVATQELEADLGSIPNTDVHLTHPSYAQVDQPIQFSVQLAAEILWNLTVDYGDLDSQPISVTDMPSMFNWNHSYSNPGVYRVTLTIAGDGEEIEVVSALSIQEPLTTLSLNGPTTSKLTRPISHQVWEVIPQSGSDILYSWMVTMATETNAAQDFIPSLQRAGYISQMTLSFTFPGVYNVTVIASNDISTTTITMVTTLQEPILHVSLDIRPVLITNTSILEITVENGNSLQFDIDFGDGDILHTPPLDDMLSQFIMTVIRITPTLTLYQVPKTYAALGEYHCTVSVFNLVSEFEVSAVAEVEEAISGLRLTSDSESIMRIGESVTMVASIDSGNNVLFDWFFDVFGAPQVETFKNRSVATYTFHRPGDFHVRVSVSNHIQFQPIVVHYPEPFIVQEPITPGSCIVGIDGPWSGAPLYEIVRFWANCRGSHVTYYFDFGDGTSEVTALDGFGYHNYTQEGSYTISVRAENHYSNTTAVLAANPFYIQIPPVLHTPFQETFSQEFGEPTNLTVQLEQGSQVYYNWSMGDETVYLFHGQSVSHTYRNEDVYRVTVVAFNKVDVVEAVYKVFVQNQVQGVEILVADQLYPVGNVIEFTAQTVTNSAVNQYSWDLGDKIIHTQVPFYTHIYRYPGTYYVTVMAKNLISNATSIPLEMVILSPIDRVYINFIQSTLINQSLEIIATMYSDDTSVTFKWDYGDGSDVEYGTELTTYHAYNETGEFTITLFASNAISNDTASSHVFVMKDRLCYPPVIRIVGGSQRKTNFSDDIKVETTIIITCEATDLVAFEWTISDSNNTVLDLDPSSVSLDKRSAFIKKRTLPYGWYNLALVVSMNGTIVYAKDSINVTVMATPLVAHIEGGTSRVVPRHSDIVLNGSNSYDLDQVGDDANLGYAWSCYQLDSQSSPCFFNGPGNSTDPTNTNGSLLQFHTDRLRLNETTAFVFVMQVNTRGRQSVETSQVLYVRNGNPVRIMLECTSCEDGIVNRNTPLMMKAVCDECNDNTSFTWTLYKILNGAQQRDYNYQCELFGDPIPNNPGPVLPVSTHPPATQLPATADGAIVTNGTSGTDEGDGFEPSIGEYIYPDAGEPSFEEYIPPDYGEETSFEEAGYLSIVEDVPDSNPDDTMDQSVNNTVVEEIESTTIVYETVETTTTLEEEVIEFEPSIEEDMGIIDEDVIPEDYWEEESNQTDHVGGTAETLQENATTEDMTSQENATAVAETSHENATAEVSQENATAVSETSQVNATAVAETSQENATAVEEANQENATAVAEASQENATAEAETSQENATAVPQTNQENATAVTEASHRNATAVAETSQENATAEAETNQENATSEAVRSQENATGVAETSQENATAEALLQETTAETVTRPAEMPHDESTTESTMNNEEVTSDTRTIGNESNGIDSIPPQTTIDTPSENSTDTDDSALPPDVTAPTSYIYQEFTYEYYEEDVNGGQPTASDGGGGQFAASIEEYGGGGGGYQYGEYGADTSIVEVSYDEYTEDIGSDIEDQNPTPGDGDTGGDPDDVFNEDDVPERGDHIVDQATSRFELQAHDTATGLHGDTLIIQDRILDEGLTYGLAVTVDSVAGHGEGEAYQYFFVNVAPHHGHCFIQPTEGNELDQIFQANCNEWVDDHNDTPLRMELSYRLRETDPQTILYYGINQEMHFQLPAGLEENDRQVWVNIVIEDRQGGRALVCSVILRVFPKVFGHGESREEYLYNLTVPYDSRLLKLVRNGDSNVVYMHLVTIATTLNRLEKLTSEDLTHTLTHTDEHVRNTDDHHAMSDVHILELRRVIRQSLLGACGGLPMRDQTEILQHALAMAQSSAIPVELSSEAITIIADILEASTLAVIHCVQEDNVDISSIMLTSIVSTASNMLDAMALNHTMTMPRQDRKDTIDKTMSILSKILKTQLNRCEVDDIPFSVETVSMKLLGARHTSLSGRTFENAYARVILPDNLNEQLMAQIAEVKCLDLEMLSFLQNPYSWGTASERITSGATSVELSTCDGQKLELEDLPSDERITMEFHHTCNAHDLPCNFTFETALMSQHQFNVTSLNIQQTFHFTLEMANQGRTLPVAVLLRHVHEPTPYEYDVKWVYSESDTKLDVFFQPNSFNATGVYYLALMDDVFDKDVYRGDVAKERPYVLRMWWGDCLYWEEQTDAWVRDGCVGLASTFETTRCQCNHLSTFAVSFHPIVTYARFVDLSIFLRPNTNAIPYSFVAALMALYAVLFIYCYFADKHDEKKQGLIYLKDNQASDQQYYEITVETGFRTAASTTARVSIVLHGDEGHSETKELICDDGRPLFERNSRDRFIVSVPESLGHIHKVLVWHNNGGISPSWYLSRIAVRDLISGYKWYFICERWFAVEEDDGKIERAIDALEEGVGFQKAFWAKGAQYFADYYIWSSIFTRPPYSVFTRVQRLTCCLSISMGFLSICAIRYHTMKNEHLELGLVDVSGEAVLVGIIVALLAIPVNFPVIMLFRRTKPNYEPEKPTIYTNRSTSEIIYCDSPDIDDENLLIDEGWESGMMEQTAMTLHNLQAWAKQKWKHRHKSSVFPPNKVAPIEMQGPEKTNSESYMSSDQQSIFDFGSVSSYGDFINHDRHRDISDSGLSSSYNHSLSSYMHVCLPRHKKVTNPKIWLPHSFLYIAWGICFGIILFSAVITSVLGYRFSQTKAIYWTQSVYFSFLQCIFITQPAVMSMFTIAKSWRHRHNIRIFDHYDDNVDLIDRKSLHRSRLDLYENDLDKGIAARQRSRYLRFARPPQAKELQKAKERMLKEKNMYTILKDGILYTIVVVCLLWMAYGKDLKDHHPVNTAIANTFVKTPYSFNNVTTVDDLWYWLQNDMLDTLYWDEWYNGQPVMEEQGTVMYGGAVLIGKVSLRQLRVRPATCHIAPSVRHLFKDCYTGFSPTSQSDEPFGPGRLWYFIGNNELHRANKWGRFGNYEGEGYEISLNSSSIVAAGQQISQLKANTWIDSQTRVVMVEFTLFNAPTNLFTSVSLLAEIPGTGAVYPFPKIESVQLYRYETAYDYFIICCEMVFLLLVAVSAKGEVHKIITLRTKYFYSTWSWIEMGTIFISLTYFCMYVTRFIFVEEVIHRFHSTYLEEFVDVSMVAYWDQCLRDLIGSMMFLIGIKALRLYRFNKTVAKFGAVIDGAIKEILLFALYFMFIEGAFAVSGVFLFGAHYHNMKHTFTAVLVLMSATIGHSPATDDLDMQFPVWWPIFTVLHAIAVMIILSGLVSVAMLGIGITYSVMSATIGQSPATDDLDMQFPVWWPIFTVLHAIAVMIILSGLIKAILCHSYKKMKDYETEQVSAGELFKFFWDHFLAFFGILKSKDSNNMGKNTLPTEFTMKEIEYQVDELLFKMNAMSHEHSMPEKCHGYLGDSDGTQGMMEDSFSCVSSDMHSFDQARLDERVQKIETNLYGANPELRELLDGVCLIDEDKEKQLRSELELEIFRQLQLQRQEESQAVSHDSGRDTQSVSDQAASENSNNTGIRPLPSIIGVDGRISFPKPLPNLGLLDMQVSSLAYPAHRFSHSKPAWGVDSPKSSPTTPDNMSQDNILNDDLEEKQSHEMGSAFFVRRSPELSHSNGSEDEEDCHPRLRKVLHGKGNTRPLSGACDLVRDYPAGPPHDNAISVEGFPLPNTLESLSSSSDDESYKPSPRHKRKDAGGGDSRRRLRKTRSQGKGKGRGRCDDGSDKDEAAVYLNQGYSTDSDESIPIIPMGPIKYIRR